MCFYLRREVSKKFPTSADSIVGGFIFLRFFSPAIVLPVSYGVLPANPSPKAVRGVTLAAKVLQNTANGVLFDNHNFFKFANDFITKNSPLCKKYFAKLTVPQSMYILINQELPKETHQKIFIKAQYVSETEKNTSLENFGRFLVSMKQKVDLKLFKSEHYFALQEIVEQLELSVTM
jgi:hypothetical protein